MTVVFNPEYYSLKKWTESPGGEPTEIPLSHVIIDKNQPTYKIQIINTDLLGS